MPPSSASIDRPILTPIHAMKLAHQSRLSVLQYCHTRQCFFVSNIGRSNVIRRNNSSKTPSRSQSASATTPNSPSKTYSPDALQAIMSNVNLNPNISTLPPQLSLPTRAEIPSTVKYYIRLGRAYGKFYWAGIKATYHNHQAAKPLSRQIESALPHPFPRRLGILRPDATRLYLAFLRHRQAQATSSDSQTTDAYLPSRADFQQLVRDQRDWAKTPLFGVLVLCLGEWLPLFVPFFPSLVPRTCRIPSQIEGMRKAVEQRRSKVFRDGEEPPASLESQSAVSDISVQSDGSTVEPTGVPEIRKRQTTGDPLLACLTDQVPDAIYALPKRAALRLSASLGLHKSFWDTLGLAPPGEILRSACSDHARYLGVDDYLLLRSGQADFGSAEQARKDSKSCDTATHWDTASIVERLSDDELRIACEERGIDVLSRSVGDLRLDLAKWLEVRGGNGSVRARGQDLLFRR